MERAPARPRGAAPHSRLGGTFDGGSWHGWLYSVAIYDRAPAAQEVKDLFMMGPTR